MGGGQHPVVLGDLQQIGILKCVPTPKKEGVSNPGQMSSYISSCLTELSDGLDMGVVQGDTR